jgi:hypothetical protein
MKSLVCFITFIASLTVSYSQTEMKSKNIIPPSSLESNICNTMFVNDQAQLNAFNESLEPYIGIYESMEKNQKSIITIPTIVHVIHNSDESIGVGSNISMAQIYEQLTILNDDFRRNNADTANTPSYFAPLAADCEINFCLISAYPSNHPNAGQLIPELGIDRIDVTTLGLNNTSIGYVSSTIDDAIKVPTYWNPDEVLNIWVCRLDNNILGYATFPNASLASHDGIVVNYDNFGLTSHYYGLGRTLTHEVGHFLGCYHTWGDSFGCSGTDLCDDTPNEEIFVPHCPSGIYTDGCTPSGNGVMYNNYMDYTNDVCKNLFTLDQKTRMHATLMSQPRRSTLSGFSSELCSVWLDLTEDKLNESAISIYPNPTNRIVNIELAENETYSIELFNTVGKRVFLNQDKNSSSVSLDLFEQEDGVYFLIVRTPDKFHTTRVILVK